MYKAGRDCSGGLGRPDRGVTDPFAGIACSGNREPAPPGDAGTESGLKVVTQLHKSGQQRTNQKKMAQKATGYSKTQKCQNIFTKTKQEMQNVVVVHPCLLVPNGIDRFLFLG